MAHLSIDELILINRWAQDIEKDAAVLCVFHDWITRGDDILLSVSHLCQQSSPNSGHIDATLCSVPFKRTRAAGILLKKGVNAETFFKLRNLKGRDAEDAFWVFLHLFKIADRDRKATEKVCTHWWHRDLSDPSVILDIKRRYGVGNL